MPMPDKVNSTSNKVQAAFSNEFTINGKTYRECSQHMSHYVTKSSCSSLHSLVDREDNGGVEERDVRFIETHSDCKVYIRGIDNHQISSIPLVSA